MHTHANTTVSHPLSLNRHHPLHLFFFFNDTAPPEIYTLPLHDALPISNRRAYPEKIEEKTPGWLRRFYARVGSQGAEGLGTLSNDDILAVVGILVELRNGRGEIDRKSTRLNSSHSQISYAVFCLKKQDC